MSGDQRIACTVAAGYNMPTGDRPKMKSLSWERTSLHCVLGLPITGSMWERGKLSTTGPFPGACSVGRWQRFLSCVSAQVVQPGSDEMTRFALLARK
jgi:hypothetical protein